MCKPSMQFSSQGLILAMLAFNVPLSIKPDVATNGHLKHNQNNPSSKDTMMKKKDH